MKVGLLGGEEGEDIGKPFAAFGLDSFPGGDGGGKLGVTGIAASVTGGDLLVGKAILDRILVDPNFFGTIGTNETANALLVDDNNMMHNPHSALRTSPATRREVGNEVVIRRWIVFRKGRRGDGEKPDDAGGSEGGIHWERWVNIDNVDEAAAIVNPRLQSSFARSRSGTFDTKKALLFS
jgi:hypothetical protein